MSIKILPIDSAALSASVVMRFIICVFLEKSSAALPDLERGDFPFGAFLSGFDCDTDTASLRRRVLAYKTDPN